MYVELIANQSWRSFFETPWESALCPACSRPVKSHH